MATGEWDAPTRRFVESILGKRLSARLEAWCLRPRDMQRWQRVSARINIVVGALFMLLAAVVLGLHYAGIWRWYGGPPWMLLCQQLGLGAAFLLDGSAMLTQKKRQRRILRIAEGCAFAAAIGFTIANTALPREGTYSEDSLRRVRAAREVVEKAGGHVYGWDEEVSLYGAAVTDSVLAEAMGLLPGTRSLELNDCRFTADAIACLQKLPGLRSLSLRESTFSDEAMAGLPRLARLESLEIDHVAGVTNEGIGHLPSIQGLKRLRLLRLAAVNDKGLERLAELPQLEELRLFDLGGRDGFSDRTVECLSRLTRLRRLALCGDGLSAASLRHVRGLVELEALDLTCRELGADGMEVLQSLPRLRSLTLRGDDDPAAWIASVAALRQLEELTLFVDGLRDEDLPPLLELPKLTVLSLGSEKLTDAGLATLAHASFLKELDLRRNEHVTDSGLANLAALTKLRWLNLAGTRVTDAGLAHLRSLPLESLDLWDTGVTDEGLGQISAIKSLNLVVLWGTRTTGQGVQRLKDSRPGLRILEDFPTVATQPSP